MKNLQITVLLLLTPLFFMGQTLTGLWTGSLSQDSNTIRKEQSFEIVLTQYKDKVYGYSRNEFIVNDTLYYIVKRVRGTIEGDVCEVKDDDIISHNFRVKPEKKVKVITTFRRNPNDGNWQMQGDWKTTRTKEFYSITGKASLSQEKDITKSKLFPHLEELQLTNDVVVFQDTRKEQEKEKAAGKTVSNTNVEKVKEPVTEQSLAGKQVATPEPIRQPASSTPVETAATDKPVAEKQNTSPAGNPTATSVKTNPPVTDNKTPAPPRQAVNPVIVENAATDKPVAEKQNPGPAGNPTATSVKTNPPVTDNKIPAPPRQVVNPAPVETAITDKPVAKEVASPAQLSKEKPSSNDSASAQVAKTNPARVQPAVPPTHSTTAVNTVASPVNNPNPAPATELPNVVAAARVAERKTAALQVISFHSDSLELSLYDNGEIDGDTVSILINNEVILARQGLKASATKKTVYLSSDSLTLVLYAENLGKYPPNTGLLIVKDGNEEYQIRFSADFQQNAAVIFKRKRQ